LFCLILFFENIFIFKEFFLDKAQKISFFFQRKSEKNRKRKETLEE